MPEADVDPFRRAAADVRAIAILMLFPPGTLVWAVVQDLPYFDVRTALMNIAAALVVSVPFAVLMILARVIRRARPWALTTSIVLLSGIGVLTLLSMYGLTASIVDECRHWWRGSAMILCKASIALLAMSAFATAVGLSLNDLLRADRMRRVVHGPPGFEVTLSRDDA